MSEELIRDFWEKVSPYTVQKMNQVKSSGTKFVHYTSASNALSIIQNQKVWMRNASEMNDFSEVQHGQSCLAAAWNDKTQGARLKGLLEGIEAGLVDRLAKSFDERGYDRERESFIISVSEHGNGTIDEDKYGRLSMWRAYGGNTNVALVMNNGPFLRESTATNAFTSPVFYGDQDRFVQEFSKVVDAFEQNMELARQLGGEAVKTIFQNIFHFAALSTKHPGFAEEREWRVILSPTMFPSNKVKFDLEVVNGVPQRVYKFPLMDYPSEGFVGATIPDLLEEIIIGPTNAAYTIYDALGGALTQAGVSDGFSRVRISSIPLRR
ncbi:DUF2971 domain-containing protein [Ruegeria arenilitoris]|uniref:DUF2971 domain-containing protein n=1 Tax=Ruegeria arenilitoris TaxID=1173585 RepID=UPI00147C89CC|nr:DUF2971 domain-containing protein [Ruegeria arenilitoris]